MCPLATEEEEGGFTRINTTTEDYYDVEIEEFKAGA